MAMPGRPAAVLIGIIDRAEGQSLLLTRRTDHLRDHAGQICLPGGRIEASDVSIDAAALRETEEEIGIGPDRIDLVGRLPRYDTTTGFCIYPVVGWINEPVVFKPDPHEVAEIFELPLTFLLDPANHHRQQYRRGGQTRSYHVVPFKGRFIWGATAGILVNLARQLRD